MPTTLKVGVIGAGGIAGAHIKRLKAMDDVAVSAVCDIREGAARAKAEEFDIPEVFTDYVDLLEQSEVEAVSVCTPNFCHAEPTIAALEAGRHVIVEKPMAMNVPEAQAMVDVADKAGKVLTVGFQLRYSPRAQMLKRAADDGRFGTVLYTRCQAMRRRGIPNWGVFGQKELQGGGPMIDIGVHILECAHYVMGKPAPVAASGQCYTYIGNKESEVLSVWPDWDHESYNVEDLAVGLIRFDNGATLVIESSFAAHIEKNVFTFQVMGEKGGGVYDPPTLYTDLAGTMFNLEPAFLGKDDPWELKMSDWVESIRTGKKPIASGEDGLAVQKMLNGIYASAERGEEIAID
ncbi:MAG: Gfo/Idh/MocA family protein [Planctomycetota bacterium]